MAYAHDYDDNFFPSPGILKEYKIAVETYMSSYVVRIVKHKINCVDCQLALTAEAETVS